VEHPHDDDPKRHRTDDERGEPRGDLLLGDGDEPVATEAEESPRSPAQAISLRLARTRAAPPVRRRTSQKIAPASAKRTPAASSGGIVSTMIRIAR
jgi:hypothetical protein